MGGEGRESYYENVQGLSSVRGSPSEEEGRRGGLKVYGTTLFH